MICTTSGRCDSTQFAGLSKLSRVGLPGCISTRRSGSLPQRSTTQLYVTERSRRTCPSPTVCSASGSQSQAGPEKEISLSSGYKALSLLAAGHLVCQLAVPSAFAELTYAACPSAVCQALFRLSAATTIPAVAALWCLKDADEHNRLGSDTYKRLNLGLIIWQTAAVSVAASTKGLGASWYQGVQIGYGAAVLVVCGLAYGKHSGNGLEPLKEAAKGFLASAQSLFKNGSGFSAVFSLLAFVAPLVGATYLFAPTETIFQPLLLRSGVGLLGARLIQSIGCNMLLISSIFYSLKDAEDRGRSGATTFRWLSIAALLTALAETGIYLAAGATQEAVKEALFGVFFAAFLIKSKKK